MLNRCLLILTFLFVWSQQSFGVWPEATDENLPISTVVQTGKSQYPRVVEAGDDSWIVLWSGENFKGVYARKVNSSGESPWGNGVVVKVSKGFLQNVQATPDGEGGVLVTWTEWVSTPSAVYSVYAQRIDPEGRQCWSTEGKCIFSAQLPLAEPHILSDSSGGAYITWLSSLSSNQKSVGQLFTQRVDSKGELVWDKSGVQLCTEAKCSEVMIAKDSRGGFLAVWKYMTTGVKYGVMGQSITGEGKERWKALGLPFITPVDLVISPRVLPLSDCEALFAWSETRDGLISAFFQKVSADGVLEWEENGRPLISSPNVPRMLEIVPDGADGWVVAWTDYRRSQLDIMAQRFDVAGIPQWATSGMPVCMANYEQSSLTASPDGSGGILLAWMDVRQSNRRTIYAQRVNGDGIPLWDTDGIHVSEDTGDQTEPVIAGDNSGNLLITWTFASGSLQAPFVECQALNPSGGFLFSGSSIKVSTLAPNITFDATETDSDHICIAWTERRDQNVPAIMVKSVSKSSGEILWELNGVAITDSTSTPRDPQLVRDGEGGVYLFWTDSVAGTGTNLKVQRLAPDGTSLWARNGIEVSSKERGIWSYRVVPDDTGGVFAVYETQQTGETNRNGIYVKHLKSSGECPDGEIPIFLGDLGYSSFDYQAISDGLGGVITAWIHGMEPISRELLCQRMDANGEIRWATSGVLLCSTTQTCANVDLTTDGQGGAILAWWDFQNRSNLYGDILAQKVDANGNVIWRPNGIPVCSSPAVPVGYTISIVSDGSQGAFIAWTDNRDYSVTDNDVYYQHLSSAGNILPETAGIPVYKGLRSQSLDSMIPDGNGRAFLTWIDDRNRSATGYDEYAQVVDASGTFKWTADGLPVTTALGDQKNALTVPDGAGGAIVVWIDQRNDLGDLYAQRIRADGSLGGDPDPTETSTMTPTPTETETPLPTITESPTLTLTPSPTWTDTPLPSHTPTCTITPSLSQTPTSTFTPSPTATWDYDLVEDGRIDSKDLIRLIEESFDQQDGSKESFPVRDAFLGISDQWMEISGASLNQRLKISEEE